MDRIHKLTIYGELPDYNTAIAKAKGDKFGVKYRQWKKETDERIAWFAKEQFQGKPKHTIYRTRKIGGKATKVSSKVYIDAKCALVVKWYMANTNKDPDNVHHAIKYILDGLQWAGVIANDGWNQVGGGTLHENHLDPDNPRVEVYLLENTVLSYQIEIPEHATA